LQICGVIIVVEAGVRYLVDTSYGFKPLARVEAVCEAQTAKISQVLRFGQNRFCSLQMRASPSSQIADFLPPPRNETDFVRAPTKTVCAPSGHLQLELGAK
jgi:hypothetical protein